MQKMRREIKTLGVEHAYAHNSEFDERVFEYNCDWFKTMNPLDELTVHDIRGFVCEAIAPTADYQQFCDNGALNDIAKAVNLINPQTFDKKSQSWRAKTANELAREKAKIEDEVNAKWFTEAGNYSTTAEVVYRFLINNPDYAEEHTALADSDIECDILCHCVANGCVWIADYKKPSIVRHVPRQFTVIDAQGVAHTFDYTAKRKLPHDSGVRLTDKRITATP